MQTGKRIWWCCYTVGAFLWHGYGTLQNENEFLVSLYLAILVFLCVFFYRMWLALSVWHEWVTEWTGEYEKYVNPKPSLTPYFD